MPSAASGAGAEGEIAADHFMQWMGSVYQDVMAVLSLAAFAKTGLELVHFAQIAFANLGRAGREFFEVLVSVELDHASEWELQLKWVHDVHDDHFAAAETDVLDALEDFVFVVEEIADDEDDAAAADAAGQIVQYGGDVGGSGAFE